MYACMCVCVTYQALLSGTLAPYCAINGHAVEGIVLHLSTEITSKYHSVSTLHKTG